MGGGVSSLTKVKICYSPCSLPVYVDSHLGVESSRVVQTWYAYEVPCRVAESLFTFLSIVCLRMDSSKRFSVILSDLS